MRRRYVIITFLLLSILLGYILGSITYLVRLPNEIRLTEFNTHSLNISLPLSATFHSETAAVIKVNDQPVTDGLNVSLQRPIIIQTDSTGTAEMTIGAFGLPLRRIVLDVVPEVEVIPLGVAIGVRINTDGVMVLGNSSFQGVDGEPHNPSDGRLFGGDLIIRASDSDSRREIEIKTKEELSHFIATSEGDITLLVRREGLELEVTLTPVEAASDNVRRVGIWVRDSTKGIGTLTFYNPRNGTFGALGHGIMDVDTKKLMSIKSGIIMPSTVTSVKKGARGAPGELVGTVDTGRILGQILSNSSSGIYGVLDPSARGDLVTRQAMPIALRSQILEGPATILTSVSGEEVREFDIYIESVNRFTTDETKGMIIRITDPELLKLTGGIVQGMSGSPILQAGRVIGAVTHVFVQDPTKGYGIFIESMIEAAVRYES